MGLELIVVFMSILNIEDFGGKSRVVFPNNNEGNRKGNKAEKFQQLRPKENINGLVEIGYRPGVGPVVGKSVID